MKFCRRKALCPGRLGIFRSPPGTRDSPSVVLDTEDGDPHDPLQLKRDYLLHEL